MFLQKLPLLVILGPTATGKTNLALDLAKKFNGELVACDSRQVYQNLDIGTGKYPGTGKLPKQKLEVVKGQGWWEVAGVKIWMYDVISLKKQYTVADYVKDAGKIIKDIQNRHKLPILVGGTGLYIKALLEGLSSLNTPLNKKLRNKLINLSLRQLQKKLKKIAYDKWNIMNNSDRNNPRRLIRAIELVTMGSDKQNNNHQEQNFKILKIGLNASREILYQKINKRVYKWIKEGIIDEVKDLLKSGVGKKRFASIGLQYGVILEYIKGDLPYDECLEKMQTKVRQYAKRQITWFKKENDAFWFDIMDQDYLTKIEKIISKWYHGPR